MNPQTFDINDKVRIITCPLALGDLDGREGWIQDLHPKRPQDNFPRATVFLGRGESVEISTVFLQMVKPFAEPKPPTVTKAGKTPDEMRAYWRKKADEKRERKKLARGVILSAAPPSEPSIEPLIEVQSPETPVSVSEIPAETGRLDQTSTPRIEKRVATGSFAQKLRSNPF